MPNVLSLALAALLGKAADDKLSGEVSCFCSISLPRSLTLSVGFTLYSCPRQHFRLLCSCPVSGFLFSVLNCPDLTFFALLSCHILINLNVSNRYKDRAADTEWQLLLTKKCHVLSFYNHIKDTFEEKSFLRLHQIFCVWIH